MESEKNIKKYRKFIGEVVSDKMQKTIIVRIDRTKIHPKYHKRYAVGKRYKVHDEENKAKIGNIVEFAECRPLSKDKRWRLVRIIK